MLLQMILWRMIYLRTLNWLENWDKNRSTIITNRIPIPLELRYSQPLLYVFMEETEPKQNKIMTWSSKSIDNDYRWTVESVTRNKA